MLLMYPVAISMDLMILDIPNTGDSSIGDTIYADWNGDGDQDTGEEVLTVWICIFMKIMMEMVLLIQIRMGWFHRS